MISKPTESELEILSILWKLKKASVREIHDQISETKDTGYTTTLKLLQIMLAKGLVKRDEKNRSHIYSPALTENDTQKSLLKGFMSTAFGGSAKNLVMQALGQGNPSQEEINEIREFLDQLEKEN
jgi:predicted transcriptional regulator